MLHRLQTRKSQKRKSKAVQVTVVILKESVSTGLTQVLESHCWLANPGFDTSSSDSPSGVAYINATRAHLLSFWGSQVPRLM